MKNIILGIITVFFASTGYSQEANQYGETPEQQEECKKNLSLYREYRDQKLFKEAIPFWRRAYQICPQSAKTLFIDGADFYEYLIEENKDNPELVNAYVDTLMQVYDNRIKYFEEEGFVLGLKGTNLFKYRSDQPAEANAILKKSIELLGNESDAVVLSVYYQTLFEMYKADKATKSDLLVEYMPVSDVLDYNIAKLEDEGKRVRYEKAKNNLDAFFIKIAECDDINRILSERLAENPEDIELNQKALAVMNKRDCTENDLYLEIAERVYKNDPTHAAAYSLGIQKYQAKEYSEAFNYFKQAAELCVDCIDLTKYYQRAGQTAVILGQGSTARNFANKILEIDPNNGEAYILIGDAIASGAASCNDPKFGSAAAYWLATDYYNKAKSVDNSIADKANQKISSYTKYYPSTEDIFFHSKAVGDSYKVECYGESTTIRSS